LGDLLSDLAIVVLMDHLEPETLRLAHELKPRVILRNGSGIKEICAVVQRCAARVCRQQAAGA
jgi:hypothetical protein